MHWLTTLFLLVSAAGAVACPLCYEAARQLVTIGQQLDMADRAVLALPVAGANQFGIVEVVKGRNAVGDVIADPVMGVDAAAGGNPCLLARGPLAAQWTNLGTIRAEYVDWLRQLAATYLIKGDRPHAAWPRSMQPSSVLSDAGWRQRIVLVLPHLESSDALVAQIAWGELARAPYANMDVVRSRIDAKTG
jgi:hypothetical protein